MALSDAERDAIRAEESFRQQLRAELNPAPPPERLARWLDNKLVVALLTMVLASVWGLAVSAFTEHLRREEAERARARLDMETILKLVPMLFAEQPAQRLLALNLLEGLRRSDAVGEDSVNLVQAVFKEQLRAGTAPGASEAAQQQAALVVGFEDRSRVAQVRNPAVATPSALPLQRQLADPQLPPRVYLQIATEADRPMARRLQQRLAAERLLAPGIENVGEARSPRATDLRFCPDKLAPGALDGVQALLLEAGVQAQPAPLGAKACATVRWNHFEVWFAPGSTG